jgi:hypothetical protein
MNVIRFPSVKEVRVNGRKCFAYGGKPYVNMEYVVKSMTDRERAYWERGATAADASALLAQG